MGERFGDLLVRLGLWHPGTEVANAEMASAKGEDRLRA